MTKITGTAKTMYAKSSIPDEQRSHNAAVPINATITFLIASVNTPRHRLKRTTPAITTMYTFVRNTENFIVSCHTPIEAIPNWCSIYKFPPSMINLCHYRTINGV